MNRVKYEVELPAEWAETARRFFMRPETLAVVVCEIFHHNPPSELILTAELPSPAKGRRVHRIVPTRLPAKAEALEVSRG